MTTFGSRLPDRPAASPRATLTAAMLGFFLITLDAVVVNVALPSIDQAFDAGVTGLQWVVDGYTMMFAALLLSAGALSDRIGARRAFAGGLVVFVAASIACGVAPSLALLVAARFLQGAAAAVMMPSSMALIGQAYPDTARRGRAVSMWALGGSLAATSGPVLGGLLTMVSWRWIFFINLPVGLVTLACLARTARSPHRKVPFDWSGQVTGVLAMGAVTFGAIEAGAQGIGSPTVVGALLVSMAAIMAFLVSQRRGTHPMVPPELFRIRNTSVAVAVGFAFMVGYFGLPFVMSLYLQQHRGLSALATGASFLPMMLTGLVVTPFSARLMERFGARTLVIVGFASMAVGLALIATMPPGAPVAILSILMMLVGLAGPLVSPPIIAVLLDSVPSQLAGTAGGIYNTSRQVGGALAVASFGALLSQSTSFMAGLRASLIVAALVSLAAAAATLRLTTTRRALAAAPRHG